MIRHAVFFFAVITILGGCAMRKESLQLAREVGAMLESYDRELAQKVSEQNGYYAERGRDHARAQLDMLPGQREQLRATRSIETASAMAGAPSVEARRGPLIRFLLDLDAEERALDREARRSAREADASFRASMRALDSRRNQIAQARRALAELSQGRRRRDEARVLIEYLRDLEREIERDRQP